jgi:hypothetical protein
MTTNERLFIDYFYSNLVVDNNNTGYHINQAYKLLHGNDPLDGNCSNCLSNRRTKLANTYVTLIKVEPPAYINVKKKITTNDIKTTTTSSNVE